MRQLRARTLLALLPLTLLAGCTSTLLDSHEKQRESALLAPSWSPLFAWSRSPDRTSWSWSSAFWLVGADQEADRGTTRALPFWWSQRSEDASTELLFPLYFGHTALDARWRFYTPLWGFRDDENSRHDYFVFNLFDVGSSKLQERWRSGLFLVYDLERHEGTRRDFALVPLWSWAHLFRSEWGFPADGVTVPALGRDGSRRWEVLNLFGFVTLLGYDDVGDRTEWRLLTLFSNEMLSPLRSWRGRGDDPFVSEWVFPVYMNHRDETGGWLYAGPFWGQVTDTVDETVTDWWALGLVARTRAPEGNTWRVFGLPVSGP